MNVSHVIVLLVPMLCLLFLMLVTEGEAVSSIVGNTVFGLVAILKR